MLQQIHGLNDSYGRQKYDWEGIPFEWEHNGDDAIKIDKDFHDQDIHAGEHDVNMDIDSEIQIARTGRWSDFIGSLTFASSRTNQMCRLIQSCHTMFVGVILLVYTEQSKDEIVPQWTLTGKCGVDSCTN